MNRVTGIARPSEADRVAVEHVIWAATQGLRPREILASVGRAWREDREPDWHDAVQGVAVAWLLLPRGVTAGGEKGRAAA